jgi:hypothetical protein
VKGAELNDLLRLGRFRRRYVQDEGDLPSCSWYIAKDFISDDPAKRPRVLQANNNEVETFGEDEGLRTTAACMAAEVCLKTY